MAYLPITPTPISSYELRQHLQAQEQARRTPGDNETILVDCDDVLLDFSGAVIRLFDKMFRPTPPGAWQSREIIDFLKRELAEEPGAVEAFENALCSQSFIEGLEPTPHAQWLLSACRTLGPTVMVTAPWRAEHWIRIRLKQAADFGFTKKDVIVTAGKHRIAGRVLIDDAWKNVKARADHLPQSQNILFGSIVNLEEQAQYRGWSLRHTYPADVRRIQSKSPSETVAWLTRQRELDLAGR